MHSTIGRETSLLKLALILVLLYVIATFAKTYSLGVYTRANPLAETKLHKYSAYKTLFLFLGFVVLLEARVRMMGGAIFGWLMVIHLFFAVPFLIILILAVFFMNGQKSRRHAKVVHLSIPFLLGTLITGIALILLRF